ncbi:MAG: hypothetical protein M0Z58_08625 [Nitrospiraceae bacterium]|nr:hypothetical protein [Nitrospiraceae bacterium]
MREYCQARGWEIVGEYVDVGRSGAKDGARSWTGSWRPPGSARWTI